MSRARTARSQPGTTSVSVEQEPGNEPDELADAPGLSIELPALIGREPSCRLDPELDLPPALLALPQPGGEPVDHHEPHSRGTFVPAARMHGRLLPDGLRNEVLPLAKAHDVDVVLRKQAHVSLELREAGVAGHDIRAPAVDIELLELVPERVEDGLCVGHLESSRTEPAAKFRRSRRAVGVEVASTDL